MARNRTNRNNCKVLLLEFDPFLQGANTTLIRVYHIIKRVCQETRLDPAGIEPEQQLLQSSAYTSKAGPSLNLFYQFRKKGQTAKPVGEYRF